MPIRTLTVTELYCYNISLKVTVIDGGYFEYGIEIWVT